MYGETSYLFLFFKIFQNVEQKFKIVSMFFPVYLSTKIRIIWSVLPCSYKELMCNDKYSRQKL